MRITVDTSDLRELVDAYTQLPDNAAGELPAVLERGALNVKRDTVRILDASITRTYLPHYPSAISYDVDEGAGWMEAEIGPDADMLQGGMGRGVEYGSARGRPIPHLIPAWEQEIPRFDKQVDRALRRSLP